MPHKFTLTSGDDDDERNLCDTRGAGGEREGRHGGKAWRTAIGARTGRAGFPVSRRQPVAVITGAGTGIGAAVTRRLAADGAAVVLVGRRQRPLHEVAAQLGERALVVAADAASATDMAAVVEAARARFGGIDTLVANAGGPGAGTAAEIADDAWADSLRVNLTTCLVSARACLPDLIRRQGSVVVI